MRKAPAAANPEEYVAGLSGWQGECVSRIRKAVCSVDGLAETIKWGHLVYLGNGPVLLLRAEETRVLFGFWRGKRLVDAEPRLRPSGKYEMATIELREGDTLTATAARRLATQAIALNATLGDPRHDARPTRKPRS